MTVEQELYDLIEHRYPHGDLNNAQTIRLMINKLVEELAEADACIDGETRLREIGASARSNFRVRSWVTSIWAREPDGIDLPSLHAELVDVLIAASVLAVEVGLAQGVQIDLSAEAKRKATADTVRP